MDKKKKRTADLENLSKEQLIKMVLGLETNQKEETFEQWDARTSGGQTKAFNNWLDWGHKIEDVFWDFVREHKKIPSCNFVVDKLNILHPDTFWINEAWMIRENKSDRPIYKQWLIHRHHAEEQGFKL